MQPGRELGEVGAVGVQDLGAAVPPSRVRTESSMAVANGAAMMGVD